MTLTKQITEDDWLSIGTAFRVVAQNPDMPDIQQRAKWLQEILQHRGYEIVRHAAAGSGAPLMRVGIDGHVEPVACWRPIETAPKDGTDIIVGFDFATVWIAHVAWYRDGGIENGCNGPEDIGWWSYVRHSVTQEKLEGQYTPTHWMPLPQVPT